ncbi:MAG: protein-disulfide reductase DsbD domain-containing protein [Flavobacteriales bacterium]
MNLRIKGLFLLLVSYLLIQTAFAQVIEPVKWEVTALDNGDNTAKLTFTASIEDAWHVYATKIADKEIELGPYPTEVFLDSSEAFKSISPLTDSEFVTHYDPMFEADLNYYEKTAVFTQSVSFEGTGAKITGAISYQACDESKCIFPSPLEFSVSVGEVQGGIEDPVTWTFRSEDSGDGTHEVKMSAEIEPGWHVYALELPTEDGPIPTEVYINDSNEVELLGETFQPEYITHYDPNFDTDLNYYENEVTFSQKIKTSDVSKLVEGYVYFMVCNDEKCLIPTQLDFQVNLTTTKGWIKELDAEGVSSENAKFTYLTPNIDLKNPVNKECADVEVKETTEEKSLWTLFLLGFGGGLIALLTPCVFPMIPLTVSFFTKGSEDKKKGMRNAIYYGAFIFLIYILLSLPFHLLDQVNENILNDISTNVVLNVIFFIIFVFFAFSFFGYYELTLPSSLANKMDNASNKGGMIGIFFMAITLAIVSFSCTGPILGSLLAGSLSRDGGAIQLTAGMGGFGAALGIPFAIFAAFPRLLNSLPQSGGWLNSVKVVLGFLELALALKFLSNADLVDHWGFLKYELFMGLWVIIFILTALYLLGKIKFPHDSPLSKISAPRMSLAVLFLAFVVYLASGFRYDEKAGTYNSLSLLSGLAPPAGYSWIYPVHCPQNIDCEKDYEKALARAKEENKPLFIDFTGYACVNCRKMEEHVWPEDGIINLLDEEYIVVSLYVDDKKDLPKDLQEIIVSQKTGKTKTIETYGDKWSAFQIETYEVNSQPYYALVSPDEILLNTPVPYTPDPDQYRSWLECGLEAWNSKK